MISDHYVVFVSLSPSNVASSSNFPETEQKLLKRFTLVAHRRVHNTTACSLNKIIADSIAHTLHVARFSEFSSLDSASSIQKPDCLAHDRAACANYPTCI